MTFAFLQEDRLLLQSIVHSRSPVKWPDVASRVPNRTGKQCRERYYNHLKPTLNRAEWSPVEDSLLYRLHSALDSKWATIALFFQGRSNNNTKNRFHQLRRRLEKDAAAMTNRSESTDVSQLKERVLKRLAKCSAADKSSKSVIDIVVESIGARKDPGTVPYDFTFDFSSATTSTACSRCGLIVPSQHTGRKLCKKTGWCEACAKSPFYVCNDLLRVVHSVRDTPEV